MQVIGLPDPATRPTALGFSPDGRLLAAWEPLSASVLDLTAGTARPLWRAVVPEHSRGGGRNPAVGFTADGRGVVAVRYTYRPHADPEVALCAFDAHLGIVMRERPASVWTVVEVGPGGRWVYASEHAGGKFGIVRWNPLTGEALPPFGESGRDLYQLAVSADERCAVAAIYAAVRVLKFTGKGPPKRASTQLESDAAYVERALAVSAGGAFAAATNLLAGECRVEAWVIDTGERVPVAGNAGDYPAGRSVHFHPTRPLLAYSTGTEEVAFWDATSRTEVRRFAWDVGKVSAVCFSPDGLRCAAAGVGKVVIWDVDT